MRGSAGQERHWLEFAAVRSAAELRTGIARSRLGFLWWFIEPVLYMGAFYLLFGIVLQRGGEGFVGFLLTGLVVWKWFDSAVRQSANSLFANLRIMRQVYLPKWVFPLIVVQVAGFRFLIVLALLLLFLALFGPGPAAEWLLLPIVLAVQFLLVLAVSFVVAAIVPLLPDTRILIENGLLLLFFLSGIFFVIPEQGEGLVFDALRANPVFQVIEACRAVILEHTSPDWMALLWVAIGSAVLLAGGLALLTRFDRIYPKVMVG